MGTISSRRRRCDRFGHSKAFLKGSLPETVKKVEYEKKQESFPGKSVSGGETQSEIDANMKQIIADLPDLFTDTTWQGSRTSDKKSDS